MKPTLLVMAAGMGSRYGGLKQMEGFGPSGETLLDYAVYDAIRAGFGKAVFVIRPEMERDFRERVSDRFDGRIEVAFAHQTVYAAAGEFRNEARQKPWGTGHAVLVARPCIQGPFAVINADDFYGAEALAKICDFLAAPRASHEYAMVGFELRKTLSLHGHVSRGICKVDQSGLLLEISEHTKLSVAGQDALSCQDGHEQVIVGDTLVSMNLWGFQTSIFDQLEHGFKAFLESSGMRNDSEYVLPGAVDAALRAKTGTVQVLSSSIRWLGVTSPGDRDVVVKGLAEHIAAGQYPQNLWKANDAA